jgi:hypothetical protein
LASIGNAFLVADQYRILRQCILLGAGRGRFFSLKSSQLSDQGDCQTIISWHQWCCGDFTLTEPGQFEANFVRCTPPAALEMRDVQEEAFMIVR